MRARHKYGAVATVVDDIKFASKKEARRYGELKLLERAGQIADLRRQVPFKCVVEGAHICTYLMDFLYFDRSTKRLMHSETKGFKTPVYKLKKRLVEALYGIEIVES